MGSIRKILNLEMGLFAVTLLASPWRKQLDLTLTSVSGRSTETIRSADHQGKVSLEVSFNPSDFYPIDVHPFLSCQVRLLLLHSGVFKSKDLGVLVFFNIFLNLIMKLSLSRNKSLISDVRSNKRIIDVFWVFFTPGGWQPLG